MTRKDTIIAAALVNASLLIILFVSALKNEEKIEQTTLEKGSSEISVAERVFVTEPKKAMGVDEVEEVLKQYAQKDSIQPIVSAQVKEPAVPLFLEASPSTEVKPPQKEEPTVSYIEVKVKKGDVLEKVAKQHHTTVAEIMKMNNLSSSSLKIGQVLKISSEPSKKIETSSPVKTPLDPTSAKYYTIKAGDNLWTIAVRNHIKVEDLLKLNNMAEEKAKKLKPGDTIRTR
ncbi:MAG: LysM peptidoglycan-binding domain-containing protein [Chlamydiota bacterium]